MLGFLWFLAIQAGGICCWEAADIRRRSLPLWLVGVGLGGIGIAGLKG